MSSPLNTGYQTGSTPTPGMKDANSLRPQGDYVYDWSTWKQAVTRAMGQNIGSGQGAGYPAGWDLNKLGGWDADIGAGPYVSGGTLAKIGSYLDGYQPGTDSWIDQHFPMPTRTGNEYIETPEAYAKRIAIEQWQATYGLQTAANARSEAGLQLDMRQQDFAEKKFAIELALDNAARQSSTRAAGYSAGNFGGGGGGGGGGQVDELALINARGALELQLLNRRLEVESIWKEADNAFRQAQLAQDQSQFGETMAYQRERDQRVEQMERGKTVSQLLSNPGDTVNAQYFLRSGSGATQADMPVGTPVDIFTGQQMGTQPMTFSELHKQNTQNAGLTAAQSGITSSTGITTPMYGTGTEITPDGWTRAPQFIAGDPVTDEPNPEMIELRVVNGEPQAKVTPFSQMLPQYAVGTKRSGYEDVAINQGTTQAPSAPAPVTPTPPVPTTPTAPAPTPPTPAPFANQSSPTSAEGQADTATRSYQERLRAIQRQRNEQVKASGMSGMGGGYDMNSPYGWSGTGVDTPQSHSEAYINPETGQREYRTVYEETPWAAVRGGLYNDYPGDSTFGSTVGADGQKAYHYTDAKGNITGYAGLTGAQVENGVTQSMNPSGAGYTPPVGFPTAAPAGMTGGADDYPNTQEEQIRRFGGYIDVASGRWVPVAPGNPLYPDPTALGGTPTIGAPNEGGYRTVETGGTYIAGPGLTYDLQPGDVIGPNGEVLTYNSSLGGSWENALPDAHLISSPEEFHALPDEVKQAILSGQPTSYMMAPGANPDWLSGMLNPFAMTDNYRPVPLGPDGQPLPYWLSNPAASVPLSRLVAGMGTNPMAGFTLLGGEHVFDPAIHFDYTHPHNFRERGYDPNESEMSYYLRNNSDLSGFQFNADDGSMVSNERVVPRSTLGSANNVQPKNGAQEGAPVPPVTPPATPPATPPGTTPGTGTGTGGTGTGGTGAGGGTGGGGTGTGAGTGGGIGANTYGPDTYQNLPLLRYLRGEISEEEYNQLSSMGVSVPGMLGDNMLPAPNSLNFSQLLNAAETDPMGFELLDALFKAGGVPISAFFNQLRSRAPLGTAFDPTMITSG